MPARPLALVALMALMALMALTPPAPAQPRAASVPAAAAGQTVDVWVRLTEPGLASLPAEASAAEREARRARVAAQQDAVMSLLRAMGGEELARVSTTQSALAVRLPRRQLDAARRIDGVQSVGAARDRPREPPAGPTR